LVVTDDVPEQSYEKVLRLRWEGRPHSANVSTSAWSSVVTLTPAASAAARSSINAEAISAICSVSRR
jgi:hypothetical protein